MQQNIEDLVNRKVEEKLKEYGFRQSEPKRTLAPKWVQLKREIKNWCYVQETTDTNRAGWKTYHDAIYKAIRVAIDLPKIDEMTDKEAERARKVFEYIANERILTKIERKI